MSATEHRQFGAGCTGCDWISADVTKSLKDDHAAHVASLAADDCCTHAALSHTYDTTARANVGKCLSPGCSCGGESARNPLPVREKSARTWENESGPEGALTPTPALTPATTRRNRGAKADA